ncbi:MULTISPECIES: hypothetical protein [Nocardia]|uniref:hypothetical protein n=1 Tax=Nocardia TaxID=1817 RepID=UPI000D68CA9E|nr:MULTISPECIES: hypothetical protein [Nocardia]
MSGPLLPAEGRKDQRGYIKLSLDFLENHRTGPLSPVTKLALIEMWIYCHRNRTNGVVGSTHARRAVPKRLRETLTAAGCWQHQECSESVPCRQGGCTQAAPCGQEVYVMHDYAQHQPLYLEASARTGAGTRRDMRPYIKLSVDFLENRRTEPLSPVAKLALIEMWMYCHRNRTNGVLPLSAFRKIAKTRIQDALIAAGSCRLYVGTTATPGHHDGGTTAPPTRHDTGTAATPRRPDVAATSPSRRHDGVVMHDYDRHQTLYTDPARRTEQARSAGKSGGLAKAAKNREQGGGSASETAAASSRDARASHKSQVISTSGTYVDIPPPVGNAREEIHPDPPPPRPSPPPAPVAPRARHGGDDAADRLNAAAPEVPATPAMRRRVLARLAPNAVAVLADPDTDPIRRQRAQADLDRAEAVIDARDEYLKTGELTENCDADLLFDPYGDNGAMRRMIAAQRPLPVSDPITVGERRAMAFRLAREHIDTLTGYGAHPPGKAREAMRAELEALLEAGVSQDVLRSELRLMLEAGLWAASKLRERLAEART